MVTVALGIVLSAVLFALFGLVRPGEGCGGDCGTCVGTCELEEAPNDLS